MPQWYPASSKQISLHTCFVSSNNDSLKALEKGPCEKGPPTAHLKFLFFDR